MTQLVPGGSLCSVLTALSEKQSVRKFFFPGCGPAGRVIKMRTMPAATAQWYVDENSSRLSPTCFRQDSFSTELALTCCIYLVPRLLVFSAGALSLYLGKRYSKNQADEMYKTQYSGATTRDDISDAISSHAVGETRK